MSDDLDRLGRTIREIAPPVLDDERRARMRARVLEGIAARPPAAAHRRAPRLVLAAAVLLVGSLAVGGAANASLPGDPAFALKLGAERLDLALSADLYRRLDRSRDHADRRLNELETILRVDPARLGIAADAYERDLGELRAAIEAMAASRHPARTRALDEARVDLDRHVGRLTDLRRVTDGDVERALDSARDTEERVREVDAQGDGDRGGPNPPAPSGDPTGSVLGGAPVRTVPPGSTVQPARTAEPTRTPDESRTPSPTRTPDETRTPDPTRTPDAPRTPDPTRTPDGRTPEATKTATPTPSRT
jgi:hypothetical protein